MLGRENLPNNGLYTNKCKNALDLLASVWFYEIRKQYIICLMVRMAGFSEKKQGLDYNGKMKIKWEGQFIFEKI